METTVEKTEKSKKGLNFLRSMALLLTGVTIGIVTYKRYGSEGHTISGDLKALGSRIMPKKKAEPAVTEQPVQERPQYGGQNNNGNGNRFQNNNGRFNSNSNNN